MMILTLLVPVLFYSIRDLRLAKQKGYWAYFILYLALMTAAMVLWMLVARNVPLTSPDKYIIDIISLFVTPQ